MSSLESKTPQQRTGRAFHLALFCAALAWSVSSHVLSVSSATGISNRFNADWLTPILSSLFLIFLLAVGFTVLDVIGRRPSPPGLSLGLPRRASSGREWLVGMALGWGMVVLSVLPMTLAGDLHISVWFQPRAVPVLLLGLISAALVSLAQEMVYRGYPYQRLMEAVGPIAGTFGMALIFALMKTIETRTPRSGIIIAFCTAIVFSIAWHRTHGLWLSWGMRFGWIFGMGVVFGLPVSGSTDYSSIIQTVAVGSRWLTGRYYGPEAAWITLVALVIGLVVMIRVTRTWAWDYTHSEIVPGGFPMDVAPPAAHTAMEQSAQAKASALVQIMPNTPQGRSVEDSPPPPPKPI
ncbi:MAG: CPBP family intramembrane metalloprotease [Edaphobacter sp.]|uniref:CPBP family intramembrane glutamic endopeptidase n=1 Tax=Edaphobacter sp. TaxID=1934404 RepID=UPI0023A25B8B|nr:CPBP family intramembrane glutamic endopeptidase [Edaphobacter sp.]MDE1175366.1 CPBP family intramembrane metalloprotease [Edaphobacter sp.]